MLKVLGTLSMITIAIGLVALGVGIWFLNKEVPAFFPMLWEAVSNW